MGKIMEPGLYNMDCMEAMKQFPDGFFDLAIVDPPYGGGYRQDDDTATSLRGGGTDWQRKEHGRWGQRFERYHIGNPDGRDLGDEVPGPTKGGGITHWDVAPPPEYFSELARVSQAQIIWGGNYFDLPPTRCFVVWDKRIPEKFTMAMCEYAWTNFNANAKLFHCMPQGKKGEERFHPTHKPVALYTWLLKLYAKPGMKILDTHAGSASSLVACHRAGLDAWGFEIDPEYFRMARERLERECAQVGLFDLLPNERTEGTQ